ncbi:putative triple gene block 1 [Gentian ovary ringspot virus]|uniref:Putative triple gene block 1 n=1 Tax=Gentian ovary ringspot virus TaxID=1920772 RepID=A0A077JHF8_9VIRU|nr:putative triple gene block 1 [Gentian ovary ringspot virus]BAP18645.1 putative triple gene block 1 [Gentian ovary ringspot virus]
MNTAFEEKTVKSRNQRRRENARMKRKSVDNAKLNGNFLSKGELGRFKGKAKDDGYDTEQLISKVGFAAKDLAEAQSRFSKRVSRNVPTVSAKAGSQTQRKQIPGKPEKGVTGKWVKKATKFNKVETKKPSDATLLKSAEVPTVTTPKGGEIEDSRPVKEEKAEIVSAKSDTAVTEGIKDEETGGGKIGSDLFKGKRDIASVVSSCCVEAGFEPTGSPLRKFPKDYFEKTGLKDNYIGYLIEKCLPAACDSQKELIERKINMVNCLMAEKDFSAGTIAGVPGCGKSTVLKKIQGQVTDAILLYANPSLESCYKSVDNSFYTQTALVADINHTFATILIDEYTLCESAEILLLQRKFKSSRVFLFGDRCQGDIDSLISPEWLKVPRIFSGKRSYRFGRETAALLKEFGLDIEGADVPDKVVKSNYEGKVDEDSQCLCFSTRTRDDLLDCSVSCKLVEGTQGQEFERVTLFVAEWDQEYFRNSQLLLVGLTRHKTYLELKTAPEVDLRNLSVAEVKSHNYA